MPERDTTADRIIDYLKNNKFFAVIVVLAIIVIGVGTLTESLDKIINFAQKYVSSRSGKPEHVRRPVDDPQVASYPRQPEPQATIQKPSLHQSNRPEKIRDQAGGVTTSETLAKQSSKKQGTALRPDSEQPDGGVESSPVVEKTLIQKPATPEFAQKNPELEGKRIDSAPRSSAQVAVRADVQAIVIALFGQTMSARQESLASARKSLPDNLTGQEIALLLGSETLSTRKALLSALVRHTLRSSVSPETVPAILADEDGSTREDMTAILAPYIAGPIPAELATKILGPTADCTRARCLKSIAPLIQRPIVAQDLAVLLNTITGTCRSQAITYLFGQ